MRKNLQFILTNLLLICCFAMYGQQKTVTGLVTEAGNMPIPGVSVVVKGTTNGTTTDFDGKYTIKLKSGQTILSFSYLGYKTKEVAVGNKTTINVLLEADAVALDEIVVVGYGSQLKENISGSVATVDTGDLETIPQVGIDQMLQGRASGVSVTTNSGQPGAAVSVRIRGVNSISGSSEPLYIVDGVPISGDSGGGSSPLTSINPSDIESLNILKDASATAIYGSRGSNGVVIITTKRGKNNKGTLSYNSYIAIQEPTNIIEVLDLPGYAKLQNSINKIYGLNEVVEYLNPSLLGEGTNWQKEIFDNALMKSDQISFAGGSESMDYFLSVSNLKQDGTVLGSSFDRQTIRTNINAKLNDRLKVGMSLTASRTKEQLTLNGSPTGAIGLSLFNSPAIAVRNPDGSFAGPKVGDDFQFENPIARALNVNNSLKKDRILGNIYAELKIFDKLTYRTEFGGNFENTFNSNFIPTYSYGEVENETNTLAIRDESSDFWVIKNLLTYNDTFKDKHDITVLLGAEAQESTYGAIVSTDGDFVGNQVPILGTGNAADRNEQYKGSNALESYFGRVIYSLDNKYGVTASMRADGSSRFAKGNKWGYFPSLSASWKISKEAFMDNVDFIQNLKFFGGYGEVGNQNIPNFAYGSRLRSANTGIGTGFLLANFENPDLKWESSTQTNLGLDFSLFDSRLNATIEVYNKVSKDFLYQFAATDFITGGASNGAIEAPWVNLGEMVNKGIDVTLSYNTQNNKGFNWNSSLTVSHYKNKVTDLGNVPRINGAMNINYDGLQNITITEQGAPIGLFYGLEVEGIFRSVDDFVGAPIQFGRPFQDALFATTWLGDIKFKDQLTIDTNGDGVPDTADGVIDGNDRTVIGNPHPDFTFGFQNSFTYKNFDLSVFLQGSYGNDVFNGIDRLLTAGNRTFTNQSPAVLDFWSVDNPNGNQPRLARNDTRNIEISDRYIEDGSYLRIQNVTLGYTLNSDISEKIGLSRLKLYGSIQNLYTFTNYSGYDPEIGSFNQNTLLTGIDAGRYPSPRTFTLGIDVQF